MPEIRGIGPTAIDVGCSRMESEDLETKRKGLAEAEQSIDLVVSPEIIKSEENISSASQGQASESEDGSNSSSSVPSSGSDLNSEPLPEKKPAASEGSAYKITILPLGYYYVLAILLIFFCSKNIEVARAKSMFAISNLMPNSDAIANSSMRDLGQALIRVGKEAEFQELFQKEVARGMSKGGRAELPFAVVDAVSGFYGEGEYNSRVSTELLAILPSLKELAQNKPADLAAIYARHPKFAARILKLARKADLENYGYDSPSFSSNNGTAICMGIYEFLLATWDYQPLLETTSNVESNLAQLNENLGRHAEALDLFTKAYDHHKNMGDATYKAYRLAHMGGNLVALGRYGEGEKCLLDAQAMYDRLHNSSLDYLKPYITENLNNARQHRPNSPKYSDIPIPKRN